MATKDWNLRKVRAQKAWKLLEDKHGGSVDWGEIEVAHVDTGLTKHRTFGTWSGGDTDHVRGSEGKNFVDAGADGPFDPMDYGDDDLVQNPGHGTRTASVLCGNGKKGPKGVAPAVPLIPYRSVNDVVLNQKSERKRVARAIVDAVEDNACEIISISLGFPQMSLTGVRHLGRAVDKAYDNGVIVTAAGGQIVDSMSYPGKFWRTIGVGGSNLKDEAYFRYVDYMAEEWVDIWAPGDQIHRASSVYEGGEVREEPPGTGEGTSYATVHVAGAAAMWLAYHGDDIDRRYGQPWQRVEAFRYLVGRTSEPLKGGYWPNAPKGILNIERLLQTPLPDPAALTYEKRLAENQVF